MVGNACICVYPFDERNTTTYIVRKGSSVSIFVGVNRSLKERHFALTNWIIWGVSTFVFFFVGVCTGIGMETDFSKLRKKLTGGKPVMLYFAGQVRYLRAAISCVFPKSFLNNFKVADEA